VTNEAVVPVSAIDQRLQRVSAELAALAAKLRELEVERGLLQRLRESAVLPSGMAQTPTSKPGRRTDGVPPGGLRLPTGKAIQHTLRTTPGLRAFEVVDATVPILESETRDARRLLFSAISGLKRKGKIRDEGGKLYL